MPIAHLWVFAAFLTIFQLKGDKARSLITFIRNTSLFRTEMEQNDLFLVNVTVSLFFHY